MYVMYDGVAGVLPGASCRACASGPASQFVRLARDQAPLRLAGFSGCVRGVKLLPAGGTMYLARGWIWQAVDLAGGSTSRVRRVQLLIPALDMHGCTSSECEDAGRTGDRPCWHQSLTGAMRE